MRLFPQIGCILEHWGAAVLPEGEPALRRALAASTQTVYAQRFGIEFYGTTLRARLKGELPLEPVFLAIAPALLQGPEVAAWLDYWLERGSTEVRLAAIYGSIFLSDEGEGMGFLVQRMMKEELKGGLLKNAQDILALAKGLRAGYCGQCRRPTVKREDLPATLMSTVKEP